MSNCKVHSVRFYKPKPRAIYCMALQAEQKRLATSRSDASIEIWNLTNSPFIERSIASSTDNFSIEGLSWSENRLFSVGLHGFLIEYDVEKLAVKNKSIVTGEAAFCLDIYQSQIAIGTEQGYLNLFQITEDTVLFQKFLDKQEGRILCLKYDSTGQFIVSGSMDAIRIWNVQTGHAIHKMSMGRSETNKPTIVWTLAVLNDFTIISGDSRGKLCFWDGKMGAQIESYQSHRADILSLCLSADQKSLYCAGVDPNIVHYARINVKEGQKWVKSIQRKIHEHDVRALVLCDDRLYSSGMDGYLACSYHPPKTLIKYPPILQSACVSMGVKSRFLMLRYPKFLEIWTLGMFDSNEKPNNGCFPLEKRPQKLAVLQKITKTSEGDEQKEGIICCCMSDDGKWVMFSTRLGIRLFQMIFEEDKPKIIPSENLENCEIPCLNALFSPNNQLIVTPNNGGITVYNLGDNNPVIMQTIKTDREVTGTITFLTISNCGKFLLAADIESNISVWLLKNEQYKFYYKLPKYRNSPTALAIHPKLANLVVVYCDNNVLEFDLNKCKMTEFSRSLSLNLPKQWLNRSYPIRNVTFDPKSDNLIILHDDSYIIVINKDKDMQKIDAKISKLDRDGSYNFRFIKKYKHLVHLSWLSDDELVAVEVNSLSIMEQLPPCFVQNTFGRK